MEDGPILLTGSAGFVGQCIGPRLAAALPHRPLHRVVRRGATAAHLHAVDLSDETATDALIRKVRPGVVVHLAAHASVATSNHDPEAVWRDNRDASRSLARAIAAHAPGATVLAASSAEVYGRSLNDGPADEETPPAPEGPYATSKLAAEEALACHLPETAQLLIARPFNHVGRNQSENFALPSFAAQIARIEAGLAPPELKVGNLATRRDFLDVRDVADTYVALAVMADRLPRRFLANVARGEAIAIGDLLGILLALTEVPITVAIDEARLRPAEVPVATARTARLASLMPWPPARPLEETLADLLAEKREAVAATT